MTVGPENPTSRSLKIGRPVVNAMQSRDCGQTAVSQTSALFPHVTVRANMTCGQVIAAPSSAAKA
jgi:ABC-type sugar transport system ATPase subunit